MAGKQQTLGTLTTVFDADTRAYMKATKALEAETKRLARQMKAEAQSARSTFASVGGGVLAASAATAAAQATIGGVKEAFSLAMEAETARVKFDTLLADAKKGGQFVESMRSLANETGLSLQALQKGAETMLGFGVAAENVLPSLRSIGEIAGGDTERMRALSLAFAQMTAAGRLMGQDLLQMVNAGFNPLQEISRKTGETMVQLKARMEAAAIPASEVTEAFRSATKEGGRFNGLLAKMRTTTAGALGQMRNELTQTLTALGKEMIESLGVKEMLREMASIAKEARGLVALIGAAWRSLGTPTRQMIANAVALGLAIAGVAVGVKATAFGLSLVNAMLTLSGIKWAINTALIIAWKATVLAAKVAVWLFNAALTVTNALLGGAGLIAGTIVISAFAVGAVFAASALYGMVRAGEEVVRVLGQSGALLPVFREIGKTITGWVGIIKDAMRVAQQDSELSLKLIRAGWQLALSQIRDLWPPLWSFINQGFDALWALTVIAFKSHYGQALSWFGMQIIDVLDTVGLGKVIDLEGMRTKFKDAEASLKTSLLTMKELTVEEMQRISAEFKITPSTETKIWELAVRRLREQVGQQMDKAGADVGAGAGEAAGKALNKSFGKAIRIDASLFGSAETASRIEEYKDTLKDIREQGAAMGLAKDPMFDKAGQNPAPAPMRDPAPIRQPVPLNNPAPQGQQREGASPAQDIIKAVLDRIAQSCDLTARNTSGLANLARF